MINKETFRFVGVSKFKGEFAVRYANDAGRARVLARNGHTDIVFIDMEQPERIEECVDALLGQEWIFDDYEMAAAVQTEAERVGFVVNA